ALPPLVIYALLGSSRSLSMGPESSIALMTTTAIGPLAAGNSARYAALATVLALLVGLLAVVAALVRLGFIADLLSRPVIAGYMAGLAVIMIASQLDRVTGVPISGRNFLPEVVSVTKHVTSIQPATTLLACAVVAFLFAVQSRWHGFPGPLSAVVGATVIVWGFGLNVGVIGAKRSAWPRRSGTNCFSRPCRPRWRLTVDGPSSTRTALARSPA